MLSPYQKEHVSVIISTESPVYLLCKFVCQLCILTSAKLFSLIVKKQQFVIIMPGSHSAGGQILVFSVKMKLATPYCHKFLRILQHVPDHFIQFRCQMSQASSNCSKCHRCPVSHRAYPKCWQAPMLNKEIKGPPLCWVGSRMTLSLYIWKVSETKNSDKVSHVTPLPKLNEMLQ